MEVGTNLTAELKEQNGLIRIGTDRQKREGQKLKFFRHSSSILFSPIKSGTLRAAYVNASYVRAPLHNASGATIAAGFGTPPDYIATQGPLGTTVADFLTMLYEQRVPHVLMLCK